MPHDENQAGMRACIDQCLECYRVCTETVAHCLMTGGEHAAHEHISTLLACAEACRTSAAVMLLGSMHHTHTCGACAEICRACADACDKMASGDTVMSQCAEVCRRCAESCAKMSSMTGMKSMGHH
jgi:hypothetical protein